MQSGALCILYLFTSPFRNWLNKSKYMNSVKGVCFIPPKKLQAEQVLFANKQ
jgi:hypothetical protein